MAHAKTGCYACERGDSLVDMDIQIDGEGILALCSHCIGDAAEAAGLHLNRAAVSEMEAAFAEERRTFDVDAVNALGAANESLHNALTAEQIRTATLQDALSRVNRPAPKDSPKAPSPRGRSAG